MQRFGETNGDVGMRRNTEMLNGFDGGSNEMRCHVILGMEKTDVIIKQMYICYLFSSI